MTGECFFWMGQRIPFRAGETIAAALEAAGILSFGPGLAGGPTRYFCGIGACQSCLVRIDGRVREACLTPAYSGAQVERVETSDARL
jgi:predicted molibdopterin-dependent oxidoreductase YjgC